MSDAGHWSHHEVPPVFHRARSTRRLGCGTMKLGRSNLVDLEIVWFRNYDVFPALGKGTGKPVSRKSPKVNSMLPIANVDSDTNEICLRVETVGNRVAMVFENARML